MSKFNKIPLENCIYKKRIQNLLGNKWNSRRKVTNVTTFVPQ